MTKKRSEPVNSRTFEAIFIIFSLVFCGASSLLNGQSNRSSATEFDLTNDAFGSNILTLTKVKKVEEDETGWMIWKNNDAPTEIRHDASGNLYIHAEKNASLPGSKHVNYFSSYFEMAVNSGDGYLIGAMARGNAPDCTFEILFMDKDKKAMHRNMLNIYDYHPKEWRTNHFRFTVPERAKYMRVSIPRFLNFREGQIEIRPFCRKWPL